MKPSLLLLSDLWGHRRPLPYSAYQQQLGEQFDLHFFDSTKLAGITAEVCEQEELHRAFVDGGIARAVDQLTQLVPRTAYLIGCSVGGVIAWQYAQRQAQVQGLLAISATRLRYETEQPPCSIKLFFGEQDPSQPSADWYAQIGLSAQLIEEEGHDIYRKESLIPMLCEVFRP